MLIAFAFIYVMAYSLYKDAILLAGFQAQIQRRDKNSDFPCPNNHPKYLFLPLKYHVLLSCYNCLFCASADQLLTIVNSVHQQMVLQKEPSLKRPDYLLTMSNNTSSSSQSTSCLETFLWTSGTFCPESSYMSKL